jgi:hypothetical protein
MESTFQQEKKRLANPFKILPEEYRDGKPYYVLFISNGKKAEMHYSRNPVAVAHRMKGEHKKRNLVYLTMSVTRGDDDTSVEQFVELRNRLKQMGTINWLSYERKWRRWNKWKGKKK